MLYINRRMKRLIELDWFPLHSQHRWYCRCYPLCRLIDNTNTRPLLPPTKQFAATSESWLVEPSMSLAAYQKLGADAVAINPVRGKWAQRSLLPSLCDCPALLFVKTAAGI